MQVRLAGQLLVLIAQDFIIIVSHWPICLKVGQCYPADESLSGRQRCFSLSPNFLGDDHLGYYPIQPSNSSDLI